MSTLPVNLADMTIHELAPRITSGELVPLDLMHACLERIDQANSKLQCFVDIFREDALLAAEAAGKAIQAGQYLGPLQGIPIALKDLLEMEGRVATGGSKARSGQLSKVTATAVKRLRAAGMIVVGKTHMVEFAFGGWGTNHQMGTPWNPRDLDTHRVPGGSSSGSGVAVGAHLVPAAIGSDTGGSVRIPASFCGTVGLKVTAGRISNHGVLPLSETLDTLGPLTRSVEDAALLFRALNGPDLADPSTLTIPFADPLPTLRHGVKGLRLAVVRSEHLEGLRPDVEACFQRAVTTLQGLGAHVEEVASPFSLVDLQTDAGIIIGSEAFQVLGHLVDGLDGVDHPLDGAVRGRLLVGRKISASEYISAQKRMRAARTKMTKFMADYDALLTPTTPITAIPVDEVDEADLTHSRFTRSANYLGLCALAVPAGLTPSGLPASLQIIGKSFTEAKVLRIGWAYEAEAGSLEKPNLNSLIAPSGS